jgi:hypothetical protein
LISITAASAGRRTSVNGTEHTLSFTSDTAHWGSVSLLHIYRCRR